MRLRREDNGSKVERVAPDKRLGAHPLAPSARLFAEPDFLGFRLSSEIGSSLSRITNHSTTTQPLNWGPKVGAIHTTATLAGWLHEQPSSLSQHGQCARPERPPHHFSLPSNTCAPSQRLPQPQPSHTKPFTAASTHSPSPTQHPPGLPKRPSPTSSTKRPHPPFLPRSVTSSTASSRTSPESCLAFQASSPLEASTSTRWSFALPRLRTSRA